MCLTTEALALFLSILSTGAIIREPGRITVAAEVRTAVWERQGDTWCTEVPDADTSLGG